VHHHNICSVVGGPLCYGGEDKGPQNLLSRGWGGPRACGGDTGEGCAGIWCGAGSEDGAGRNGNGMSAARTEGQGRYVPIPCQLYSVSAPNSLRVSVPVRST
jgi:hypothetical protein